MSLGAGCGAGLGGVYSSYGEAELTRGAEKYVDISDEAKAKVDLSKQFIRDFAEPHIAAKLDEVAVYYADGFYLDEQRGMSHDGVALPLGGRIVLLREYVEAHGFASIAVLYAHELQHMCQATGLVGTPEGEQEARDAEARFREVAKRLIDSGELDEWLLSQP